VKLRRLKKMKRIIYLTTRMKGKKAKLIDLTAFKTLKKAKGGNQNGTKVSQSRKKKE